MFKLSLWVAVPLIFSALPVIAQPACSEYVVLRGDSLADISKAELGSKDFVGEIYTLNRAIIGHNRNILQVGMTLQLPCFGDAELVDADPIAATAVITQPSRNIDPTIRLVASSGMSWMTGKQLPDGGLLTNLVETALQRADDSRNSSVEFQTFQAENLSSEMSSAGYDLSFPWFLPDCSNLEPLIGADKALCTEFVASNAFYSVAFGMFSLTDGKYATATSAQDLMGANICRPAAYIDFDLAQAGLLPPDIMLSKPDSLQECIDGLLDGTYDIVTLADLPIVEAIAALGLGEDITELKNLASVQTLHVLAPKHNPNSRVYLTLLNTGLRDLTQSGDWFEMVIRHLSAS